MFKSSFSSELITQYRTSVIFPFCLNLFQVLGGIKPLTQRLLKENPDSKVLRKLLEVLDSGCMDEDIIAESLKHKELGKIVTKRVDRSSFESYDEPMKRKILGLMIDQSLSCKIPEVSESYCYLSHTYDCFLTVRL
jgi:hypothetical protein